MKSSAIERRVDILVSAVLMLLAIVMFVRWGGSSLIFTQVLRNELQSVCASDAGCQKVERMARYNRDTKRLEAFFVAHVPAGTKREQVQALRSNLESSIDASRQSFPGQWANVADRALEVRHAG